MQLWPLALERARNAPAPVSAAPVDLAAAAVLEHCRLAIDATAEHCVAVKLQLACFERLGAPGRAAMGAVAEHARTLGMLVIADGKRGDIDVSAAAYAAALLGETATPYGQVDGLGADAVTVSPMLGSDSLAPFVAAARERGRGLFVLVRTSNPGARDVQEQQLADGGTISDRLALIVDQLGRDGTGAASLSDVGAVVGATAPERLRALRELMPHAVLLLPGVGAQGGIVEELGQAFAPGPAGALITVSRSIVNAHGDSGEDPALAAASAAEGLRALAWSLSA